MNGAVQGDAIATASTPDANAFAPRFECDHVATLRWQQRAELEHARQVQCHHEEQQRQRADDRRRLQLEAPAELLAGGAQSDDRSAQQHERDDDAGRERDAFAAHRNAAVAHRDPTSASAFSDSTGNTQGIRFSSSPPPSANASASGNDSAAADVDAEKSVAVPPCAGLGPAAGVPATATSSATALTTRPSTRKPGRPSARPAAAKTPARARAKPAASNRCGHRAARPVCGADGSISRSRSAKNETRRCDSSPAANCSAIVAPGRRRLRASTPPVPRAAAHRAWMRSATPSGCRPARGPPRAASA